MYVNQEIPYFFKNTIKVTKLNFSGGKMTGKANNKTGGRMSKAGLQEKARSREHRECL